MGQKALPWSVELVESKGPNQETATVFPPFFLNFLPNTGPIMTSPPALPPPPLLPPHPTAILLVSFPGEALAI